MEAIFSEAEETLERALSCIRDEDDIQLSALHPRMVTTVNALRNISRAENDEDVTLVTSHFLKSLSDLIEVADELLRKPAPTVTLPKTSASGIGRPSYVVPVEEVRQLRKTGLTWTRIGKMLGVSAKTLRRHRDALNLDAVEQRVDITDESLDFAIKEIINEHPNSGYVFIWSSLKAKGIFVTYKRLKEHVRIINPVGIFLRSRKRIMRRKYKVKGAKYLYHMDANEKLVGWRFYFHGCVDGFSRKIIYLGLAHNKTAAKVLDFFAEGVEVHGVPVRVRGDGGTENALVAEFMSACNLNIKSPFIIGRSVHNVRIERLWKEVNRVVSSKFKIIFRQLQNQKLLDQNSYVDLLCLSYVFFERINNSLQNFVSLWNVHGLSSESAYTPDQLWLMSLTAQRLNNRTCADQQENDDENSEPSLTRERHAQLFDFSTVLPVGDIHFFKSSAIHIVPDPLMEDNNDGKQLYCLLRSVARNLVEVTPLQRQQGATPPPTT